MRFISKVLFVALALTLTAGPLLAAPVSLSSGQHLTAPAAPAAHPGVVSTIVYLLGVGALGITIKRDTGSIAQKFQTRASAAAPDYKAGVSNAGSDWEAGARAGSDNWKAGVQDAITRDAFGSGVAGKATKYQTNAVNLGSARYPQGVQNAAGAYAQGVQPYLDVLKSLNLPPAGPRRSPQNMQRANAVALALGNKKTGK